MKKIFALALALIMSMSIIVGCDNTPAEGGNDFVSPAENATVLLNGAYDAFAEKLAPIYEMDAADIKMMFPGGYYDENDETTMTQGPGNVPVENDMILSVALFPEANLSMIDNAALVQHPMMQNFFVTVAFHVTDLNNVNIVAAALNDSLTNAHWMCGQPEGFVIITAGDYVVLSYGLFDNINPMKEAVLATYEGSAVAYEGSFVMGDEF